MNGNSVGWTDTEKQVAHEAFQKAYNRETSRLIKEIRESASAITQLEDIWRLHNFLSARRHEIDGKYDYNYEALVFVFATLVKQGWLHIEELSGLDQDKIAKVSSLARM